MYKWNSPHEWLIEHCSQLDKAELLQIIQQLVIKHDADTIQDLYESDMDADGFFDEVSQ